MRRIRMNTGFGERAGSRTQNLLIKSQWLSHQVIRCGVHVYKTSYIAVDGPKCILLKRPVETEDFRLALHLKLMFGLVTRANVWNPYSLKKDTLLGKEVGVQKSGSPISSWCPTTLRICSAG